MDLSSLVTMATIVFSMLKIARRFKIFQESQEALALTLSSTRSSYEVLYCKGLIAYDRPHKTTNYQVTHYRYWKTGV